VTDERSASDWALKQVEAVRDDPAERLALLRLTYHGPTGRAPHHLPFRRAATAFMRWQLARGVLAPPHASPAGSPWWRAADERLLRDGCEVVARSGGRGGALSLPAIQLWIDFVSDPRYELGLSFLVDRRSAGVPTTDYVQRGTSFLTAHRAELAGSRWAVFVGSVTGYGMARMGQTMAEPEPFEAQVFTDIDVALAWLEH
jgi:hypothetical protein